MRRVSRRAVAPSFDQYTLQNSRADATRSLSRLRNIITARFIGHRRSIPAFRGVRLCAGGVTSRSIPSLLVPSPERGVQRSTQRAFISRPRSVVHRRRRRRRLARRVVVARRHRPASPTVAVVRRSRRGRSRVRVSRSRAPCGRASRLDSRRRCRIRSRAGRTSSRSGAASAGVVRIE